MVPVLSILLGTLFVFSPFTKQTTKSRKKPPEFFVVNERTLVTLTRKITSTHHRLISFIIVEDLKMTDENFPGWAATAQHLHLNNQKTLGDVNFMYNTYEYI